MLIPWNVVGAMWNIFALPDIGLLGRAVNALGFCMTASVLVIVLVLLIGGCGVGLFFLLMFIGWEGVGLCSYLLIGFWYKEEFPPYAGRKAFIVNRIGDFGFMIALMLIFSSSMYSAGRCSTSISTR